MDIEWVRSQFPALKLKASSGLTNIYFDGPGGSQTCQQTIDAISNYLINSNANLAGDFPASHRTTKIVEETRALYADFFNCSSEEVVFGANMTTLTWMWTRCIGRLMKSDDEIIVTKLDHDANVTTWTTLAKDLGLKCHQINVRMENITLDAEDLKSKLNSKTRLVALGAGSNAVGSLTDIPAMVKMVRAASPNAWVYVDGVHFAPHASVDVKAMDCDFFSCSSYKFFGPHFGISYARKSVLTQLRPYKLDAVSDAAFLPFRFETGTQNFECVSGAAGALRYLLELGKRLSAGKSELTRREYFVIAMDAIQNYERDLSKYFLTKIKDIPSLQVFGITNLNDVNGRTPTFAIRSRTSHPKPKEMSIKLGEKAIAMTVGNFYAIHIIREILGEMYSEGVLRIGFLHYNTTQEIDFLLACLKEMF